MLKRLSASLAPSSSSSSPSPSPSISPSHSSASLDRIGGFAASGHQGQQQQHAAPSHYISHPHSAASSSHDITTASNASLASHSSYPRPSGLSTPYAAFNANSDLSPISGYFGIAHPSSSSASNGGLTPSLHDTSRNVSPAQSPRLEYGQSPTPSNEGLANNATKNNWASTTPPAPIDRQTLQKSLRCLETMLVALDEYRELSARLAKVEKRIAKAGRDLAGSMSDGSTNKGRGPTSTLSALSLTSSLFDTLSEISTKFSKHLSKEYDLINEIIGKTFKKIAKEERLQDDLLESLDTKLKKANYNYDKRIRASSSSSNQQQGGMLNVNQIQKIHEQYSPILTSLTEEISKSKQLHNFNMSNQRAFLIKELSKSLTCLSEIEFRKNCEILKKLGGFIGNVLAVQSLLGPSSSSTITGGGGKNMEQMPLHWPPELVDIDEMGRMIHRSSTQEIQQEQEHDNASISQTQRQEMHNVHPLASRHASSSSSNSEGRPSFNAELQHQSKPVTGGRTLDDLLPPRAPFSTDTIGESGPSRSRSGSESSNSAIPPTTRINHVKHAPPSNRTFSDLSSNSSNSTGSSGVSKNNSTSIPPRSASLNQLAEQELLYSRESDEGSDEYQHLSVGRGGGDHQLNNTYTRGSGTTTGGMRSVSFPVEQMHGSSVNMDHDATVTQRTINHHKPSLVDTSFFPTSHKPENERQEEYRDSVIERRKGSPTYRDNKNNIAKLPSLQPALNYSPSQSGKVGYFDDNHHDNKISSVDGENDGRGSKRENRRYDDDRKMPSGFVMEETSPEQSLKDRNYIRGNQSDAMRSYGSQAPSPDTQNLHNQHTKPVPRNLNNEYTSAPNDSRRDDNSGAQLERSSSIESTASEHSFVARMRAKYAEEKKARLEQSQPHHRQYQDGNSSIKERLSGTSFSPEKDSNNNSDNNKRVPVHRGAGRRVSTIAQKWEEKTSSSSSSLSNLTSGRPNLSSHPPHQHHQRQQHRASMPIIPSVSSTSSSSTSWSTNADKPDIHRYSSADSAVKGTGEYL